MSTAYSEFAQAEVYPLTGKLGVHIFDGELEIDLSEINTLIDEDDKRDDDM